MEVSWDDEIIPTEWKYKIHVPNHQPDIYIYITGIGLPENQPAVESRYLQVMYSTGIPELRRLFSYPRIMFTKP